jgi:hypothetical protein
VFQDCSSLTNFITYANVTININYSSVILPLINNLQNVTFGFAGQISDNACANCVNLQNVTIGPLITNLGLNTFTNCSKLTSNTITEMLAAGFTQEQMLAAGITMDQILAAQAPIIIAPEAPTNLVATISGNTASVTFEQTENVNVTSYTYAYSIDGGATYSDFSSINLTLQSSTQISISGLINGKTYYFKLKSSNGVNSYSIESTPSNSVFVNFAQPAPKIQLVSAINTELSMSFTQDKYDTAYDITSYECSINGGLTYITIHKTSSPFQVPLPSSTNATYSVIIRANNGILSAPSNTFTLRKTTVIGKKQ